MQMDKILSSTTVPTDMKLSDVYPKVMNVTIIFQSMINSSWFGNVASATGIDTHASEWTKIAIEVSNMMNTQVRYYEKNIVCVVILYFSYPRGQNSKGNLLDFLFK